ncbi:MAG: choice-of-anchor W domain-containing protein [Limnospira sp.]
MKKSQILGAVLFGTFGLGVVAPPAEAVTLTRLFSDSEMNELLGDIAFVAEGRIGDRGGFATHELNLHESDPGDPQVTDQFDWLSGIPEPFELAYDAASSLVNFTLGDRTLTQTYDNPFSDFFLRTRATQAGSSMRLGNLQLDGVALDGESYAIADTGGLDILRIRFLYMYFILGGIWDGHAGFAWCTLQAFYEYSIRLKVRELQKTVTVSKVSQKWEAIAPQVVTRSF